MRSVVGRVMIRNRYQSLRLVREMVSDHLLYVSTRARKDSTTSRVINRVRKCVWDNLCEEVGE